MNIHLIPAFDDNYIFAIEKNGEVAVVDPGDAEVVQKFLESHNFALKEILLTHHHFDHIGGVKKLRTKYEVKVHGSFADQARLPDLDIKLRDGDSGVCLEQPYEVGAISGHTIGHIFYFFPKQKVAFVGDTLFNHGCGRMFEGTPAVFWQSLCRIRSLPSDTMIYCAHEYTMSNLEFATHLDPDNQDLQKYKAYCQQLRSGGLPTVPFPLKSQLSTNPFLRCDEKNMMERTESKDAQQTFAAIRKAKDQF